MEEHDEDDVATYDRYGQAVLWREVYERRLITLEAQSQVKTDLPERSVRWLEKGGRWHARDAKGKVTRGRYRLKGKRGPRDKYLARKIGYVVGSVEWQAEVRLRAPIEGRRTKWRADVALGYTHLHVHDDDRRILWRRIFERVEEAVRTKTLDELTLKSKTSSWRMKRSDQRRRPGPNQWPHNAPTRREPLKPTPAEEAAEREAARKSELKMAALIERQLRRRKERPQ